MQKPQKLSSENQKRISSSAWKIKSRDGGRQGRDCGGVDDVAAPFSHLLKNSEKSAKEETDV